MEPFIGEVMVWGCNFAPRGWAQCNGSLMAISSNEALFSILGTTYGGDGRTTFGLPDLRGRIPIGSGNGPGLSNRPLGQKAGVEQVTLTVAEIPSHSHTYNAGSGDIDGSGPSNNSFPNGNYYGDTGNDTLNPASVSNSGGNQPHHNLSPTLGLRICIALFGIYPSRS